MSTEMIGLRCRKDKDNHEWERIFIWRNKRVSNGKMSPEEGSVLKSGIQLQKSDQCGQEDRLNFSFQL
jgi:hypothetical protein